MNEAPHEHSGDELPLGMKSAATQPAPFMVGNWAGDEDPSQEKYRVRLLPKKTIQIAVSGQVHLSEIEREIIDTESFQRLRGVRQLGAACQVYPTALHTRFDHSIGTMGVVAQMITAIRTNEHNSDEERRITRKEETLCRLYGLLHDVPHVPFGHTIEDELGILERHDKNKERIEHFFGLKSEIGQIIVREYGKEFHELFLKVYQWDEKPEVCNIPKNLVFLHDIVSNTVCADLLDYLKRDDHFCNLGVGMEYHFLNYLYLTTEEGTGFKRVFVRLWKKEGRPRRDILTDLCRLLEARYLVAERVYFHHAKITAGTMLGRAIQESAAIGEITEETIRDHTDDTLVRALATSKQPLAKELGTAYRLRNLYECVREYRDEDIMKAQAESHQNDQNQIVTSKIGSPEDRRDFENYLAACTDAQDGDFLLYAPERKMNMKEAEMKVFWSGRTMPFKEIDDPIVSSRLDAVLKAHRRLWSIRLLAKRSLTEGQISLARHIVETELFKPQTETQKERLENAKRIIEDRLESYPDVQLSERDRRVRIDECAEELVTAHHGSDDFRERIGNSVKKHFLK
jgi:HD superfamily phosphohydrolase